MIVSCNVSIRDDVVTPGFHKSSLSPVTSCRKSIEMLIDKAFNIEISENYTL